MSMEGMEKKVKQEVDPSTSTAEKTKKKVKPASKTVRVKDPASDSSANYEEDDSMFTDREETTRHNKKEETSEESSDEDDEEIARSAKRPRRRWIAGLQVDSQDEDGLLEAILPRDKILPRRSERFLPVYQ